uniref:transglutaminase TgpA family protein n=1 Tax=Allorhizocola rhizosphaerae TaxID=1872709 RepID=UPI000E3CD66C
RRLAVAGVIAAVVLPLAVPGMTTGLLAQFGGEGTGPGDGSGRGGRTVDLFANLHGKLTQLNEVDMVRVTTTDREPFYLKFAVADDVQLNGFRQRTPSGRPVTNNLPQSAGVDRQPPSQRFEAKIEVLRNFDMPMMPAYSIPVGTQGLDSTWSYDPDQQVIYSTRSKSPGRTYTLSYVRPLFDPNELRQVRPLAPNHPIQRSLAEVPNVPAVQAEVDRLTRGKTTVYDKVRALYDYFSQKNGFQYDLSTREGTTGQHITDFLQQKKGFCEQYAAALTWMVRAAGIPARVAFGFTRGGSYSNGTYTLKSRNLHAWTEVYFDGYGWVPFDATPSGMVTGSVTTGWAPNVDAPEETPSTTGPTSTPGPQSTENPAEEDPRNRANDCPDGPCATEGEQSETPTPAWVWWSGGGGAAALILLLLPALRRQMLRRKRNAAVAVATATAVEAADGQMRVVDPDVTDTARRKAHAAWDELMDTLVDYRIPIDVAETPRMTADRLVKDEGLDTTAADNARLLGHAEERARYSQRPVATEGLAPAVKEVRRTLAAQAGRWVRLTAVMLPPSVVQRWRTAASNATTRFSNRTAEMRLAVRRLASPLRLRRAAR